MKRTIIAKGKNKNGYTKSMIVKVDIEYDSLTQTEVRDKVESVKNRLHDFMRENFNHSEIKIS